jgi:flagellar basal-body rod protein FlgG
MSIAASGLQAQQARADALGHAVANSGTPGFREPRVALEDAGPGVRAVSAGLDTAQGALAATGRSLDLAVDGGGFFAVRRPDGQLALTRGGSFTTDATGQVVTPGGAALVPPLRIPPALHPSALTVAPDGTASAGGVSLGRIQLVDVPAPTGLAPLGDGLYATTIASGAATTTTRATVQQGYVEQSGVDLVAATVDLLAARTSYAANVRSLETHDELLRSVLRIGERR